MKELTKKQKLGLISACIKAFRYRPDYLCRLIASEARSLRMITPDDFFGTKNSRIAITLIPEFLQFKPQDIGLGDPWFPRNRAGHYRRGEVLNELRNSIYHES